ncbi:glycine cleavage system protein GcvH [Candidatus Woesearchaeota archaeon]|nr:glycine cleavage system protein GcvH [Candidatus Woesearchaeota archaeon]
MNIPEGLHYSKEHEWARLEGGTVVMGITDYAQGELHDIVYVELPKTGTTVKQMGKLLVLETMKAVADVFSPASGEVIAVNERLLKEPQLINTAPYGDGWLVKLKATNAGELKSLMDAAAYQKFIAK